MRKLLILFFVAVVSVNATARKVFVYSPGERDGMRLSYVREDGTAVEMAQIFTSDYGTWGAEKHMFSPYTIRRSGGGYVTVFQVNDYAPCIAVAFGHTLTTWRPQDYPYLTVKGCLSPVIKENEDGGFSILFLTKNGEVRKFNADKELRRFGKDAPADRAEYDAIKAGIVSVTVNGKEQKGNVFDITDAEFAEAEAWLAEQRTLNERYRENLNDDKTRFASIQGRDIHATINIDGACIKPISDKLIGIFFEDISYAADGGLYAEMVQNRDFEYTAKDNHRKKWNATTAWRSPGEIKILTENPLTEVNSHYAVVANDSLINAGWDGMVVKKGDKYDFSLFCNNLSSKKKTVSIALIDNGKEIGKAQIVIPAKAKGWQKYEAVITANSDAVKAELAVIPSGKGDLAVDMISLFPQKTFMGRKNGLRNDLAKVIADLKPKFIRFPGGCMSHGQGIENIYHWQHTVGPLEARKPDMNIWNYHQTRGLGFFEFFQFCEDIGAEPLPVLAAGVPCQNSAANAEGFGGQQDGIPMADMPAYIEELCDLIEWANGDPQTNKWARMRAEAGHPEPFNLKYLGIGNEDIISSVFEERCLMICKEIKKRYPDITICGTVGPFHAPSSDYIEGWDFAKKHKDCIDMVDEHYYESEGWFLNNQHYYDDYDRTAPKVYLGEYACNERKARFDGALCEAAYLCNIERNADIVAMTSYAPLLCKNGFSNWAVDMIYFTNTYIDTTPSYDAQRMFSEYSGNQYIETDIVCDSLVENRLAASVVRDEKTGRTMLKVVNITPNQLVATVNVSKLSAFLAAKNSKLDTQNSKLTVRFERMTGKQGAAKCTIEKGETTLTFKPFDRENAKAEVTLPPYSFTVYEW